MTSPGDTPDRRARWTAAAGTFASVVVVTLLYRLVLHLCGWGRYTLLESVLFALVWGLAAAAFTAFRGRSGTR